MRPMSDGDRLRLLAHHHAQTRRAPSSQRKRAVYPFLSGDAFEALGLEAKARGTRVDELATLIIETVAEGGLFGLVLEGETPRRGKE